MAKSIEYKVVGTSKTEPKNLPDGLTVETTKVRLTEKIPGGNVVGLNHLLVEESVSQTNGVFLAKNSNNGIHLTEENTRKLRDLLNTILGEKQPSGLRIIRDGADGISSNWVWVEVETDKFTYLHVNEDVPSAVRSGTMTFRELVNTYGTPASIDYR